MPAAANLLLMPAKCEIGVSTRHLRSASRSAWRPRCVSGVFGAPRPKRGSPAGSIWGAHSSQSPRPTAVKALITGPIASPLASRGISRKL